jgi:hypothetical protein
LSDFKAWFRGSAREPVSAVYSSEGKDWNNSCFLLVPIEGQQLKKSMKIEGRVAKQINDAVPGGLS